MTISELKAFNIREKKLKTEEDSQLTFQKLTKGITRLGKVKGIL